jgi:glycosyltransferase involved in cell wall biosynthesis
VKIAIVVQRYGATINGGAELHARYIAEHLARHVQVEVLTTCASDYITWRNALAAGVETVNGVTVRRFPVTRERDPDDFGRQSVRVFTRQHALRDELLWLEAEGPTSPALVNHVRENAAAFDFFIFFSFRYYHAYHGARAVADKAILVPTAERDAALGLAIFPPVFRGVRAFMYNSYEERALIQAIAGHDRVPGVVVGVGSEIPAHSNPARFRQKFNMRDRFAIYVGRIDENKGCAELFDYFQRYSRMLAEGLHLVLIGNPVIPIPQHPKIHHVGFVSDQDKFDAIAAADLLIMPSYLESLSIVALEAWALGKPVLANGRCDVLKGQCIRSNGGLYYETFPEFIETLRAVDFSPSLAAALGRNGRDYFNRHYAWPIVERKYLDMLDRLARADAPSATPIEPLPGWWARRRQNVPAADDVVSKLPTGPALSSEPPPEIRDQAPASKPRQSAPRPQRLERRAPEGRAPQTVSVRPPTERPAAPGQRADRRPGPRLPGTHRRRPGERSRRPSGNR